MKNSQHNIQEHKVTFLNCLFFSTQQLKPKDIQFTNHITKEKQQILTCEKL